MDVANSVKQDQASARCFTGHDAVNQKVLVCGASGRLGRLVAEALRDRHAHTPRLLVRPARLQDGWQTPQGMEPVSGDFTDTASLDAALDGVASVFLVSPVHPDMRARELALAAAAARCPAPPQIVKISGLATRLDSPVDSGRWHAQIEQGIRALRLPATFLRPNFFFQNLAFQVGGMRRDGILRGGVGDAA
ncbi:MAG: NmrA family NAD(P)-binding protein, partial [Pseudomonadales bacterium]|nr:NmrA family NAD(P)-binding protein [Pseudomonadales bacterium]